MEIWKSVAVGFRKSSWCLMGLWWVSVNLTSQKFRHFEPHKPFHWSCCRDTVEAEEPGTLTAWNSLTFSWFPEKVEVFLSASLTQLSLLTGGCFICHSIKRVYRFIVWFLWATENQNTLEIHTQFSLFRLRHTHIHTHTHTLTNKHTQIHTHTH